MSIAHRLGTNMAAALIGKIVVAIAGLATVAIMTRHLGAEGYGVVKMAQTFVLFAAALAHLGLHYVMVREISVDESRVSHVIGSALSLRVLATTVALVLASIAAIFTSWSTTILLAIALAAVGMIAYQGNEIITAVLQWRLNQIRATAAETVGTLAALVGVVLVAHLELSVLSMTFVSTAGLVISFVLAWYLANQLTAVKFVVDPDMWRRLAQAGLPLGLSSYLEFVTLRGDALLLSFLKSTTDVGLYGVVSKIYEVSLQLPVIFTGLLMPLFARAASEGARLLREQLTFALHLMAIIGVGIILTLGFFSVDIVSLLAGSQFLPAAPAVQITGCSIALAGYSMVLRCAAIAQEKQKKMLVADMVITASALAGYFIFIPYLSFIGASLGTLVAELVALGLLLNIVSKGLDAVPWLNLTNRVILSGCLAAGILYLLNSTDLPALVRAIIGIGIYAGLLLLTGAINVAMLRLVLPSKPPQPAPSSNTRKPSN